MRRGETRVPGHNLQPCSQSLSSSHKRQWSTTPSCGKTKDPGNEVAKPLGAEERTNKFNPQDAGSGNRTRCTLVGGKCSHHCAISAPQRHPFSPDYFILLHKTLKVTLASVVIEDVFADVITSPRLLDLKQNQEYFKFGNKLVAKDSITALRRS